MPQHSYHRCWHANCAICVGGFAYCTVCGGAEASLPSECPGRKMTREEHERVYNGELNFADGKWIELKTEHITIPK